MKMLPADRNAEEIEALGMPFVIMLWWVEVGIDVVRGVAVCAFEGAICRP